MKKKKTPTEIMTELIVCLPKKDIKYAQKFINSRDFEKLYDLVLSDIRIIEKQLQKEKVSEEYQDINLEKLQELFNIVNEYLILLNPNWLIDNQSDEYEEQIEEESEWTENHCLMLVGRLMKTLIEKTQL